MSQFQVNQECFCPDNKYSNSINIPGIAWFGQCHLHRCWRGNFWPDFGSQTEKAWRERSKGLASSGQNKQSSVKYRELSLFFLHKATRFQCVVRETSRNIYRNTLAFAWNRGLSRACFHTFQAMSHELSGPLAENPRMVTFGEAMRIWGWPPVVCVKKHLQRKTTKNDQLIWWRNTSVIIFLALTLFLG